MHQDYILNEDPDFEIDVVILNDNITNRMSDNIHKTVKDILIFWKQIKNEKNGLKINEISESISKKMRELKDDIYEMEHDCKKFNVGLLELYIKFLQDVTYNEKEALEYGEHLKLIKKSNRFAIDDPDLIVC